MSRTYSMGPSDIMYFLHLKLQVTAPPIRVSDELDAGPSSAGGAVESEDSGIQSQDIIVSPNFIIRALEDFEMVLTTLCVQIEVFKPLQHAKVVATECYLTKSLIPHRYLVLELRHLDGSNAWLRLDRRVGLHNLGRLVSESLTSPAHDTVRFAPVKTD